MKNAALILVALIVLLSLSFWIGRKTARYGFSPPLSTMDSEFVKNGYYKFGKQYPVYLESGELFSGKEPMFGVNMLSRYQAAKWLGFDPETGQKLPWR